MKGKDFYTRSDVCWYGHIFRRFEDAAIARDCSRWHSDADAIVKVWGGWKIIPAREW